MEPKKLTTHKSQRVSIQGIKGSYSHIAAAHIFGDNIEITEREDFTEVFEDLAEGNVNSIVIPIENSTHGSVYQNYDNLTKYGFPVVGELYLKIKFHLIANKGARLNDIDTLYTHPVALNQIKAFLEKNKKIKPIEYSDTAASVKLIKDKKLKSAAAAASRFAAKLYGMEVLEEDIQENGKNYTRFFVLGEMPQNGSPEKTTIQFILGEEPGSLYKSLRCFADRDISLSKIESRPILNTDWEYRFYVDVEASENDDKMQNAMRELEDYVKELNVLGTYLKGKYIET
jgi:prephenate dehydratase